MPCSPVVALRFGSGGLCGRRAYALDLELELDAVAHEHATRLERLIPHEAEVLPVDGSLRCEADPLVAPRILAAASELRLERDRTSDAVDGQLTRQSVAIPRDLLEPRAE